MATADPFIRDPAYEQKVQDLVLEALMTGLMDKETRRCVFRTGEIASAMMSVTAMLVAVSGVADTPTKAREFCAEYGRRLQRRIGAAKAHYAAHGKPFETVRIEGELH